MQETRRRVLAAIADGPIGGPDLAADLSLSRAAVWKHVEALRSAGFDIESGPDGYELMSVPEYGGPAVAFGLNAPFDIEYHDSLPSTNDRARELAAEGAVDVAVLADEQTGGRGRLDRAWASPSGGIWVSVVLRPDVPPAQASLFTLAAGVATADAVARRDVPARIKWPNDVLVEGKKLAGILTEMEGEADRVSWLVVGVGVNANVDPAELPNGATSLLAERGEPVDRRTVVQDVLEGLDRLRQTPGEIVPAWRDRAATLGQRVRVERSDGPITGRAVGVTDTGALVVEADGERVEITTGDCEHLRPSE